MFNVGPAEILVILIAVLLIFPPKQLPDIARTVGKFLREFRRQTEEVRSTIEREFYQMEQELDGDAAKPKSIPAGVASAAEDEPKIRPDDAVKAKDEPGGETSSQS